MASWLDIKDRLARLNAGCVYVGEPVKAIANIQSAMITGHWPVAINVKKAKPDSVIMALPLVEYERLVTKAGELESLPADVGVGPGLQIEGSQNTNSGL